MYPLLINQVGVKTPLPVELKTMTLLFPKVVFFVGNLPLLDVVVLLVQAARTQMEVLG